MTKTKNGSLNEPVNSADIEALKKELKSEEVDDVSEFVSTGSVLLDYAISNRRGGGIPVGRITELIGENQAGKTLIATQILANTQKLGGIAVCIDTEHDIDKGFSYRVGLQWDKLIYKEYLHCLEEVFEYVEEVVKLVRAKYPNKLVTIVWDSIAATPARAEIEGDFNPTSQVALHARIMSKGLRKIRGMIKSERIALVCTNQLRTRIGVSFGDNTIASHGKAMSFYASVRVKLARTKKMDEGARTIGAMCQAKVIKNKVGPPWRTVDFLIRYDYGVDEARSILEYLCDVKAIEGGAWRKITFEGEEFKFRATDFASLLAANPKLHRHVLELVDKHSVVTFTQRPETLNIDIDSILEVEQIKANMERPNG